MKIYKTITKYMLSNTYLIEDGQRGIIIDPCKMEEVKAIIAERKLTIDFAILTHEHYDHISGLDWMHTMNVPVIASHSCNANLKIPKLNQSRYYDVFCAAQKRLAHCEIVHVDEYRGFANIVFKEQLELIWKTHHLLLKETPGHSDGSICIVMNNEILFSGDTLLGDTFTGTKIPGGSQLKLKTISMPWLRSLNSKLKVYPGHGMDFFLGERMSKCFDKE